MVWNDNAMEGAGRARFDRFGGNRVGWEGETQVKWINVLNYTISQPNLQNKIKSFDTFIDHPVAEVLPRECFV